MKVVFLCGGTGRRMFPIPEDKFLLTFVGKTLLEHQIETAKKAGLTEFLIVVNPQNLGKIQAVVDNIPGIKNTLVIQEKPLGIANALESASQFIDGETMIVNPNDVFESLAYTRLLDALKTDTAVSYLLGYEMKDYFPGGYLVVDNGERLKRIIEKPGRGKKPSDLVNILVHLHTDPKTLLRYVTGVQTAKDDAYEYAIDTMARDGQQIKVIPYTGKWNAIKYPWHIFTLARHFLDQSQKHISPSAHISDKATITGQVVISDNVMVLENAVIRGPVYIGPNSVIGNNSLIRDYSHIGTNCLVGYSTEVKASYIADGCWFHSSYIGDSIIGSGCSFAAGTVLANFRFDEGNISVKIEDELIDTKLNKLGAIIGDNCRTGINVSVMPGVRIGPNSIVGPHVCLTSDLERDTTIMAQPVYRTIRKKLQVNDVTRQKAGKRIRELRCAE